MGNPNRGTVCCRIFAAAVLLALVAMLGQAPQAQPARGQRALPPNQPELGLIYDGLELDPDGPCKDLYHIKGTSLCTPGPTAAAPGTDFTQAPPPVDALEAIPAANLAIQCDGDGASGNRVQAIYAHPSGTDRYSTYLNTFRDNLRYADDIFNNSAAETGGARHIRFVHDASCQPVVLNVTLPSDAFANFTSTINALSAQGYNRTDRKYVVFTEATVFGLGVSTMEWDERLTAGNANNSGPSYTRHDVAMWNGYNQAHELMHTLGAVGENSPNSTGYGHCTDEYDRMCYADTSGLPMRTVCADTAHEYRFDCNHDDYYHTNPPAGRYLATHWNAANNAFLIGAQEVPRATKTWTGAVSTNWYAPGNWSPSGAPDAGEDCVIPGGKANYPVVSDSPVCDGKLTVQSGGRLTVAGNDDTEFAADSIQVDPGGEINIGPTGGFRAGSAQINGAINLTGKSYFDVDTAATIGATGLLWQKQAGEGGVYFYYSGTLTVNGTLRVEGAFRVWGSGSLLVSPSGLVEIGKAGDLTVEGTLTNSGSLRQTRTIAGTGMTAFLNITNPVKDITKYSGVTITPISGSLGDTTVTVKGNQMCQVSQGARLSVRRCYLITPTGTGTADVRFYFREFERNIQLNPKAYHYTGSSWGTALSSPVFGGSGEAMYVQVSQVSGFNAQPFGLFDPDMVIWNAYLPMVSR